jgi:hypothetical protein
LPVHLEGMVLLIGTDLDMHGNEMEEAFMVSYTCNSEIVIDSSLDMSIRGLLFQLVS